MRAQAEGDAARSSKRAHPDLGRLGVFWHTQGSGKSYSMAFFAEKVRRTVPGNFTFLLMTDRERPRRARFTGPSSAAAWPTRRRRAPHPATSSKQLLKENHRFVFSLIHKFNQDVNPNEPYSERDDIIVISDEAHRTQAGQARPQHAPGAAERGVHRLHRHAAVQARRI